MSRQFSFLNISQVSPLLDNSPDVTLVEATKSLYLDYCNSFLNSFLESTLVPPHTPPHSYQSNPEGSSKCTSDHPPTDKAHQKKQERRGKEEEERGEGGMLSPELALHCWDFPSMWFWASVFSLTFLTYKLRLIIAQVELNKNHWYSALSDLQQWQFHVVQPIMELLWDEMRLAQRLTHRKAPWTVAVIHLLISPSAQSYLLALQKLPWPFVQPGCQVHGHLGQGSPMASFSPCYSPSVEWCLFLASSTELTSA